MVYYNMIVNWVTRFQFILEVALSLGDDICRAPAGALQISQSLELIELLDSIFDIVRKVDVLIVLIIFDMKYHADESLLIVGGYDIL